MSHPGESAQTESCRHPAGASLRHYPRNLKARSWQMTQPHGWLAECCRAYASLVTLDEVGRYAESLPQVKRKGTESRPGWYVHDRLVARLHDRNTLVIRVPLSQRESLLETYPESFGVPPRMEAHHKVEAYLDRAEPLAVRAAIQLAWEMQRS
jgi:hypothetical protein